MSVQSITQQTGALNLKIEEFWHEFSPFGSKADRFFFKNWHFIILAYCILLLVFDFTLDFHRGISLGVILNLTFGLQHFYKHELSFTATDLTNWVFISEGVALSLIALSFNRWLTQFKPTMDRLFNKGHIQGSDETLRLTEEYLNFLTLYQAGLRSKKRFILIGIILSISVGLIWIAIVPSISGQFATCDSFYNSILFIRWPIFLIIGSSLFLGYCIAVGIWIAAVTGNHLRKLTQEFDLVIQPNHPDKCGGLKFLGNFCLSTALPVLIAMVFLGVYGIGLVLSSKHFGPFALASNFFLFLVAVPLSIITFLRPLWEIHVEMLEIREKNADEFAKHISSLAKNLQSDIEREDWSEAKTLKEAMDLMERLLTDNFGYLTWPFNFRILLTFLTPQLVTLSAIIIGVDQNSLFATALKTTFSLFGH